MPKRNLFEYLKKLKDLSQRFRDRRWYETPGRSGGYRDYKTYLDHHVPEARGIAHWNLEEPLKSKWEDANKIALKYGAEQEALRESLWNKLGDFRLKFMKHPEYDKLYSNAVDECVWNPNCIDNKIETSDLWNNYWKKLSDDIEMDPLMYADDESPVVREYARKLMNGE